MQTKELSAFISSELAATELEAAGLHVKSCERCQRALAAMKDTEPTLEGVRPNPLVAAPSPETPAKIGPYVVLEKLGEGGMASVYTAYHPQLERKVAIKVLKANPGHVESPSLAHARLIREAQSMAQLDDPHVVGIHDVGSIDGQVYLVMDRVDGVAMSQWLKTKPRDWREIQNVMVQAGRGLVAAHTAGIIHRDFKPANVLVGNDGRVRVADFGIARKNTPTAGGDKAPNVEAGTNPSGEVLTLVGRVVGTPVYMAPEQFAGATADARSDQFSFCVSLYEAFYKEKPFKGISGGLGTERFARPPSPPSNTKVPKFIRDAVLKGLSVDPAQRFETMQALLAQIGRQPVTLRVIAPWAAVVALALVSTVAGWWITRPPQIEGCEPGSAKLADTWDAPARQTLQRAFAATSVPEAALASERVVAALDQYAQSWGEQQTKLCTAALDQPRDSPILGELKCLKFQKMHFRAVIEVLSHPTPDMISFAPLAPASLMPPSRCADARALSSLPRTPSEPVLRESVQTLRFQIANALALNLAGQPQRALTVLKPLVLGAEKLAYPPFEAEAHQALAETHALLAEVPQALEQFRLAARAAEVTGQDALAANATASGAFFSAYSGKREAAELMVEHAEVLLERAGGDPFIESQIENSRSLLEALSHHSNASLAHQRRAVELRRQVFGPMHPRTLFYLGNLAQGELEQCRPTEAVQELRVFDTPEAFHRAPSIYARGLTRLAAAQAVLGDLSEAQRVLALAKALITTGDYSDHAEWLCTQSLLYLQLGDGAGALRSADEAVDVASHLGTDSPIGVLAREALAASLVASGRGPEAVEMLERELPLHQKVLGDNQKEYFTILAAAYLDAKQFAKAAAASRRALEEQQKGCATPEEEATVAWLTAQALGGEKTDAARSRALATSARDVFAAMPWRQKQVAAIDVFLKRWSGPER